MIDLTRARRSLTLAAFLLALAAVGDRLQALPPPQFVTPSAPGGVTAAELAAPVILDLPNPAPSAHSVSLVDLGDSRLGAAWFAGSREGADDVSIVFSTFDGKQWTPPSAIVTNQKIETDERRVNRKIGNPVLWLERPDRLHLWFVTVSYGGWAGSSLNHQISSDLGEHWQKADKLVTSPFLNISTLVRTPPLPLADGGFALPVYHEFIAKHPEWLRLDQSGRVVDKQSLGGTRRQIQPSAVALDAGHGLLLTRDAGSGRHAIHLSRTDDGGQSWSPLTGLDLPNPDASVALTRLHDGRLLLVYNPLTGGRRQLALALSSDGQQWAPIHMLESGQGDDEFSYPAVLQMPDGTIHVAYTWQRQHIRQQILTPGLLDRLAGVAGKTP
ncbi:MAG: sialidase family protein [Azonexus sp.]